MKQWDLFTSRDERLKTDRSMTLKQNIRHNVEKARAEAKEASIDPKISTLRTFISFNFPSLKTKSAADEFIGKPLFCLGGASLLDLKEAGYWSVVEGWMREYKLYRGNKKEVAHLTKWAACKQVIKKKETKK